MMIWVIAAAALYLIYLGSVMNASGFLFSLWFRAVPILLGVTLGVHALITWGILL